MTLKLVIGNKNYSSWSMRPWLALRANDIAFEEIFIPLYTGDADKQRILELHAIGQGAGAGRWRRHGLGFAGHHRICRRAVSGGAAVAGGSRRRRPCAFDLGGDAFGLCGAAQRMRHEPASAGRRRSRCRTMRAPTSRAFSRSGSNAASATESPGRSCSAPSAARTPCLRRWCIAFAPMRSRWRRRCARLHGDDDGAAGLSGMDPRRSCRNPRDREIRDGMSRDRARCLPVIDALTEPCESGLNPDTGAHRAKGLDHGNSRFIGKFAGVQGRARPA